MNTEEYCASVRKDIEEYRASVESTRDISYAFCVAAFCAVVALEVALMVFPQLH